MLNLTISLWKLVRKRRQIQLLSLLFIMILNGIAEVFSLASIVPFLSVLISPERLWDINIIKDLSIYLGFESPEKLILPVTLFFIFSVAIAGFIRLINLWLSTQLTASIGTDIGCETYKRAIFQPYTVHIRRNTAEIINLSTRLVDTTVSFINSSLLLLNSFVLGLFITLVLFIIDWKTASIAIILFSSSYLLIARTTKNKILKNGLLVQRLSTNQVKILQEGFGAIRDVLLNNTQSFYMDKYQKHVFPMRKSEASSIFLSMFPRYALDSTGLILISFLAYLLFLQTTNNLYIFTILGSFALGAQRLLPAMQQIYGGWSNMCQQKASVEKVINILKKPIPKKYYKKTKNALQLKEKISFKNVYFKYHKNSNYILEDINFDITKGERVGIIGETGSGKSTLMDIILGLLEPTKGKILLDNQDLYKLKSYDSILKWQASIAHVPQQIFLTDNTVMENIAFGLPKKEIDLKKVKNAAKEAQIFDFFENSKYKFNTLVGERGVRLSGGQRQRIGIARALYKGAKILIFDEATSALDQNTESQLMQAIKNLNSSITIILITHRLNSLKYFDKVIEIKNKKSNYISLY